MAKKIPKLLQQEGGSNSPETGLRHQPGSRQQNVTSSNHRFTSSNVHNRYVIYAPYTRNWFLRQNCLGGVFFPGPLSLSKIIRILKMFCGEMDQNPPNKAVLAH